MKIYYQFNMPPFCCLCLGSMETIRHTDYRDENGVVRAYAWCANKECPQYEKRFVIPPLSVEVEA